jgi:hypothetical protein
VNDPHNPAAVDDRHMAITPVLSRNASIAVLPGGIVSGLRVMTSASFILAALFPSARTR